MRTRIKTLLAYSWNEARRFYYNGQISEREWAAYCRVWGWINVRFSEPYESKQEAVFKRGGMSALYAKINRTRAAFGFEPLKGTSP